MAVEGGGRSSLIVGRSCRLSFPLFSDTDGSAQLAEDECRNQAMNSGEMRASSSSSPSGFPDNQ